MGDKNNVLCGDSEGLNKMTEKKYKLNFELVPDACWGSNLRSVLRPKDWDTVRHYAYACADGHCMICGRKVKRLEAHEVWSYDEKQGIQKLENVIAICSMCHSVIHIGRTQLMGNEERAAKWFMTVNKCTYSDYIKALNEANIIHRRRNLICEWKLDVSWLARFD